MTALDSAMSDSEGAGLVSFTYPAGTGSGFHVPASGQRTVRVRVRSSAMVRTPLFAGHGDGPPDTNRLRGGVDSSVMQVTADIVHAST